MRPVRVQKIDVLEQLRKNRELHHSIFLEAVVGYREEVIRQLETHLEEIRSGKPKRTSIHVPSPEDHTQDYDNAIEMLEMSVDDVIELDSDAFMAFYKDQWGWKKQFLASNSGYSQTANAAMQAVDADF